MPTKKRKKKLSHLKDGQISYSLVNKILKSIKFMVLRKKRQREREREREWGGEERKREGERSREREREGEGE